MTAGIDRVGVIGCGAAKRDERTVAKNLYTSTYFGKNREYVESECDNYRILSAEHGFVTPMEPIEPYDTTLSDDDLDREALIEQMLETTFMRVSLMFAEEVVILAGQQYVDLFLDACEEFDRRRRAGEEIGYWHEILPETRIWTPYQDNDLGGIGEQMAWVKRQLQGDAEEDDNVDETKQTTLIPDGGTEPCPECGREMAAVADKCAQCLHGDRDPTLADFGGESTDAE